MAVHKVMDHTGDTRHEFDPGDPVALKEANDRFAELTGKGFLAYAADGNGGGRQLKAFDPEATETVFRPPLIGG